MAFFFTSAYISYILVKCYFSTKTAHSFMHTKNLVIPTYQQTFPHYPQIQIILLTVLCEKHATIYRITTSYAQVINILCISTDVRCFYSLTPVDNYLKNLSIHQCSSCNISTFFSHIKKRYHRI